jgi:hypothetical protein
MSNAEVLDRLQRIYAAVGATVEGDLSKFPPKIVSDERGFSLYQDFLGGLNPAQLSNLAHDVIHNIANLQDHFRRWAPNNGHDPKLVDQAVSNSFPLRVIKDLSNNDKHGYPPRGGGHSGKAPKLVDVKRSLEVTSGTEAGSGIAVILTSQGPQVVTSGGGRATVVITGTVVDGRGATLGNLHDFAAEALRVWEHELQNLGVL